LTRRKEELRRQTIESEILRLAARHSGRLTSVEVASDLAISPEAAKDALDSLSERDLADIQITESGVIVYSFRDVRHLGEKAEAKGVLDA
jgi:predicted ArsR family transcriptional regulator